MGAIHLISREQLLHAISGKGFKKNLRYNSRRVPNNLKIFMVAARDSYGFGANVRIGVYRGIGGMRLIKKFTTRWQWETKIKEALDSLNSLAGR